MAKNQQKVSKKHERRIKKLGQRLRKLQRAKHVEFLDRQDALFEEQREQERILREVEAAKVTDDD